MYNAAKGEIMLTFSVQASPAHGEFLVFLASSRAPQDTALLAAFSSEAAALEVTEFFNWLAENRNKVEKLRDAQVRPAMVGLVHAK